MVMEEELNIANILKDKPKGTKLYADAFGELSLDGVGSNTDEIIFTKTKVNTSCCFYNDGKYSKHGEPILVPSKEMRDWSKFAWQNAVSFLEFPRKSAAAAKSVVQGDLADRLVCVQ